MKRKILLSKRLLFALMWMFSLCMFGQSITVNGTVQDESGQSLIGVTIQIEGALQGTVTDANGRFTLTDTPSNARLVVSYVGMQSQTIEVNGRTSINIVLREDTELLEEVVVTGFGLSQRRATLTGAISSVTSSDIEKTSAVTTSGALVGKIAGVNFRQPDGRPGNGFQMSIRNMGTPLYIIDGVPMGEGQFNFIDFNDIESISILKDASASIYGLRAANGVVVVTTKKGRRQEKNTITVNAQYGWQNLAAFSRPADAATYVKYHIQSQTLAGVADQNRRFTMEDLAKWQAGTEKGYVPFDWYDYVFNTSPQSYIGINTTGGSERINYYVALSNTDQVSNIVNYGGFNKTNLQLNIEANITDKLKIGAGFNGRIEKRKRPGVPEVDDYWYPIFGTYRNLPIRRPFANDNPKYPTLTSTNAATNFGMLNYEMSGTWQETWRVGQAILNAEYELLPGLKARGLFNYFFANRWFDNHEYTYKLYGYDEATDTYPVIFENKNPWREREIRLQESITSNLQLAYDKVFNGHSINAVAGMEMSTWDEPNFWLHSIPASNALTLIDVDNLKDFNDYGADTQARIGYIGKLNYNYAEKYLIELSARYDGSWKFPPGKRWGFFPSASAGWRISEEEFWKNSDILDRVSNLKIRASYGLAGDDNLNDWGYLPFDYLRGYDYKQRGNYRLPGTSIDGKYVVGTEPRGLPVTNMSWLKAKLFDVGLDYGLFDGKLSGTFDYFRRLRTGIPASRYDIVLPSEVGFGLPRENLNSDMVQGYDAMIRWSDKIGSDFRYTLGANITYSRFFDWHQYKPRFGNSWEYYRNSINERVGHIFWGLEHDGQFQTWEEIAAHPIDIDGRGNTTIIPGDFKYKDVNGDNVINWLDERPAGYRAGGTPNLNYGINGNFMYKGFDLSFNLNGGGMFRYEQQWEQRLPFHDGGNNPQFYFDNSWRLSNIMDANSEMIPGKYPFIIEGRGWHSSYFWNNTFWHHNVKYMKLRDLQVGYTLPATLSKRMSLASCRVYFSGQNLFIIKNTPMNIDPEVDAINGLQYPTVRVMNLGITLKF